MNEDQLEVDVWLETCGDRVQKDLEGVEMEFVREGLNYAVDEVFLRNYVFGICDLFLKKFRFLGFFKKI